MSSSDPTTRHAMRALALTFAAALTACGGGGGGESIRPTPPIPNPPPPPAPPPPPPSGTPESQPARDGHLTRTNANAAHDLGYTGAGVRIGIVDTGVNRSHPALTGRVEAPLNYVDGRSNDLSVGDVNGHGTMVAEIAAGRAYGRFAGGIAPDATIVPARMLIDDPPPPDPDNPPDLGDASFFSRLVDDLMGRNVDIVNNSWSTGWSRASVGRQFFAAYDPFVNDYGGLLVWAAGNSGEDQPSQTASLATIFPELERGWLAVVALDTDDPTALARYSNACGVAMNYCLAAPGSVVVGGNDDPGNYYVVRGTSLAAPQVTGAAALVWDAFPWFSNDLVRQTLLGTATDLGAPGVDPVFGHGLLDVGRAVLGPARFDWGTVTAEFSGGTSFWENDISGAGGLTKRGNGVLVLEGDNSYSGQTRVEGGVLAVDGRLTDSQVTVGAQGGLTGFGSVGRDVVNHGVVGVGGGDATNSGDFRIEGDYTQAAGARLAVELGSRLEVGGSATLHGGDLHVLGARSGYTPSGLVSVLVAAGGVDGRFDALTHADNVLVQGGIMYEPNEVLLYVTHFSAAALAAGGQLGAASAGAAQRVEEAFRTLDVMLARDDARSLPDGFLAAAGAIQGSGVSMAAADAVFASLSGEVHGASAAMTFESIDASTRALSARLDQVHARQAPSGAWSSTHGLHGGFGRSGLAGLDFDLDGWLVGNDMRLGQGGVLGFGFGQSQAQSQLAGGADRNRSRASEALAYAGLSRERWYAQGSLGAGRFDHDVSRFLLLGAQPEGVWTDYSGRFASAYAETGYRFDLGDLRLTPYVGTQFARVDRDGFTEQGGAGFGLRADAGTLERWQAMAGLRAERTFVLANGRPLQLSGRAQWQQTLDARGDVFDASLNALDDWQPLVGVGLAEYGGLFGLGLASPLARNAWLSLDYDHRFGQRGDARMLAASFRYVF
ncbi:autotransporter domain-containing protein [Coralloluteibacterium thermophilus]|uniref:Autotransporter domain-containing protein n=1 Tax=Coralloluteibacterium thermophilum TaxID=2707049 RepID=A0ABV9NH28_9GAMM